MLPVGKWTVRGTQQRKGVGHLGCVLFLKGSVMIHLYHVWRAAFWQNLLHEISRTKARKFYCHCEICQRINLGMHPL
jgi:hypothetical protein